MKCLSLIWSELSCCGRVNSSYRANGTRRVTLVKTPIVSYEWGMHERVSSLLHCTVFLLNFGDVPAVWYLLLIPENKRLTIIREEKRYFQIVNFQLLCQFSSIRQNSNSKLWMRNARNDTTTNVVMVATVNLSKWWIHIKH
jgi:hypothetical protein